MLQKTYFKTKDYCKVKFMLSPENAETVEILGLNSDWENSIVMKKKKFGSVLNIQLICFYIPGGKSTSLGITNYPL